MGEGSAGIRSAPFVLVLCGVTVGNGVNVFVLRGVAVGMTSCAMGAVGVYVALGAGVVVGDNLGSDRVGVALSVTVTVGVALAVMVCVGVSAAVTVSVFVAVAVSVGSWVYVAVAVLLGVAEAVGVAKRAIAVSSWVGELATVGVCGLSTVIVQPVQKTSAASSITTTTTLRFICPL